MTVVDVYNLQNEKVSEVELKTEVFETPIKNHILHQVVVDQLATRRAGTASVKRRSDVKASGRKLSRQKGTGRARVGSASSPTRRGGGVAFGPNPRNYGQKVPKKVKQAALRMALTDKVRTGQLIVVDNFELPEIKTKKFAEVMKKFHVNKAFIVTHKKQLNLEKSSKNVTWVTVTRHEGLNAYDILRHDFLFLEQPALRAIEERLVS